MHFRINHSSSNERTAKMKRNIICNAIIRSINILVSLILVPITINYITPELYGIWLSLSSIVAWFGLFDIGFGLGMRNRLTTALAFGKYKYGKILVSTTYAIITAIFIIVGVISYFGCTYVDWSYILNISSKYNEVVVISFQIMTIAFCLRMILQLISNVCQAYQNTALASSIDMVGNLLSLLFMLLLTKTIAPNFVCLSAIFCLSPFLAYVIANIVLFMGEYKDVSPSISYVRRFVVKDITSLGINFFIIQIVCMILYQTTNIIISHYCGPESVTIYNISYKYLTVCIMVFTVLHSPIWSAFSDAYAKKDYIWMQAIYKKLIRLLLLGLVLLIIFIIISPVVYKIWIGDSVKIPSQVTILLGVYTGFMLVNNIHTMIINGMSKLKLELLLACLQSIVFPPLVIFFASYLKLTGILFALIIISIIPNYLIVKQAYMLVYGKANGIYNK